MMAMHPSLPLPTTGELHAIAKSPEIRTHAVGSGVDNIDDYSVDQVAAVLEAWGKSFGRVLRLGCLTKDQRPFIQNREDGATIIWIHNNGNNLTKGEPMGHYEGMRALGKDEGPEEDIVRMVRQEMDVYRRKMQAVNATNEALNVENHKLQDQVKYPKSSFSEDELATIELLRVDLQDVQTGMVINNGNFELAIEQACNKREERERAQAKGK